MESGRVRDANMYSFSKKIQHLNIVIGVIAPDAVERSRSLRDMRRNPMDEKIKDILIIVGICFVVGLVVGIVIAVNIIFIYR